jgi:hypothetical protein
LTVRAIPHYRYNVRRGREDAEDAETYGETGCDD